ncbi:hypothetical protein B6A42_21165 [Vibrio coralliilyticus]|nr:hypothetical protein B6A42_21165 [Vibrio coralliilyticus]
MSPEDSALVAKDSALIGLSIVLDEASVLALMQHRLPNAQISAVKKVYIRYKPSTNCIVKYQVSSALGEQQWYVKAFSVGQKERFERIEHNQYSPYDVLVVKEYRLVFYSFPYDARLKILKRVIAPESLQRLLERVLYPGSISHPQIQNLDVLQYKPERRLVVKVELNSGNVWY